MSGASPSASTISKRGGLLALDPGRVHRVDQLDRVGLGQLAGHVEAVVEVAVDLQQRRAVRDRLASLPIAILPSGHQHGAGHAGLGRVGGRRRGGVAGGGADDGLGAVRSAATEIAIVMPRSLNDPVGLRPSTLRQTCAPVRSESARSGTSGVPPSRRVTTGAPVEHRQPVGVLARSPRATGAPSSVSFHAHHGGRRPARSSSSARASTVAASAASRRRVGDDDELRAGRVVRLVAGGRACWRTVSIDTSCSANAGRDLRQHARPVGHVEADVVAGRRLAHRQDAAGRRRPTPAARGRPPTRLRATATRSPSTAVAVGSPPAPAAVEHQLRRPPRPRRTRR